MVRRRGRATRERRPSALAPPTIPRWSCLTNPETWVALFTLTVLEIVLGIDNVIFISILVQRLPAETATAPGWSAWASRWACGSCCC